MVFGPDPLVEGSVGAVLPRAHRLFSEQRLLTAWSLVRVRLGEPNFRRAVGGFAEGLMHAARFRGQFRKFKTSGIPGIARSIVWSRLPLLRSLILTYPAQTSVGIGTTNGENNDEDNDQSGRVTI